MRRLGCAGGVGLARPALAAASRSDLRDQLLAPLVIMSTRSGSCYPWMQMHVDHELLAAITSIALAIRLVFGLMAMPLSKKSHSNLHLQVHTFPCGGSVLRCRFT